MWLKNLRRRSKGKGKVPEVNGRVKPNSIIKIFLGERVVYIICELTLRQYAFPTPK